MSAPGPTPAFVAEHTHDDRPGRAGQLGGVPLVVSRHAAHLLPWMLAIFLVCIIGLTVWSHQRWKLATSAMVSQADLLAVARTQVAEAEVLTEQWLAGEVSARPEQVLAKLDRAATAGDDLILGRPTLRGLEHLTEARGEAVRSTAHAYRQAIGEVRERMLEELRQPRRADFVVDLRQSHARLSDAAMALERAMDVEARARLRGQARLAAFEIILLVALACSLYAWLYAAERRREQSLRDLVASEARNRAFIQTVPELAFVIDASGRIQDLFAAVPGLLHSPPSQQVGRRVDELFPPDVAAEYLRVMHQAREQRRTQRHEYTLPVRDGLRVFEARVAAIPGTELFFWACWDVTQRHATETGLRQHSAALAGTRDGVMMLDEARRIVFVNRAFTTITGIPEASAVGLAVAAMGLGASLEADSPAWEQVSASGSWQGEADGLRSSGEVYTLWMSISAVGESPDLPPGRASHLVVVFTDVSHLRVAEARLERLAHYDPLTDLPNRSQVLVRLDQALELARQNQHALAVFYIDLDHFKTINDSLGHTAGDALLIAVAERLRGLAQRDAVLGRLGGDEFLLAVGPCAGPPEAVHIAQSVLDVLKAPLRLPDGREYYTQASIGVSLFPQDGHDAGDLIRDADTALHQAKAAGRNSFRFYIGALTHAVTARLEMETRLRRALDHEEFELWYQPLVRLADGALLGVEALVRLRAGDGALVNPAAFIPLMEETGLIVALGDWVRREACRQGAAWRALGFGFGSIAVNVSPVEIARGGLVERLRETLQAEGLPSDCIEIEITESGLMEQGERAEAMVAGLAALGVKVSLDDFGTGYSSLAHLKRFKVDKLKIDRSFIRDLPGDAQDAKLVGAIVAMGHSLDLTVLAEGVETEAQAEFLRMRGCHSAQGYHFSMPMDAASLYARYAGAAEERSPAAQPGSALGV